MKKTAILLSISFLLLCKIKGQSTYFGISSGGILNPSAFVSLGQPIAEYSHTGIIYLFWDDFVTSTNDIKELNKLIIKPNPVSEQLNLSNAIPANEYRILSLDGKIIRREAINNLNSITINLPELVQGMYILSLFKDGHLLVSRKFIKE